ncbi:cytochrome P450 [Sporichthya brevicatena]|uniref:Cytochrome P450 n=2 Tax=Sporichthya brevicatena TaxID=171442 RepID=A0ABN1GRF8_9ACTN
MDAETAEDLTMPADEALSTDPDDLLIELMSEPQPADPYPLYHALRSVAPNFPSILGVRFLSSHAACLDMLRSTAFQNGFGSGADEFADHPFIKMTKEILIFTNPPQHTRMRRLAAFAFTPKTVVNLRPAVQAFVDERLDAMADAGKSEIMADLGSPVPAMVVCKLLDAPMDDYAMVQAWVDAVSAPMKPVLEADLIELADAATIEFDAYIKDLIAARRRNLGDDLLSRLIAAEEDGDRLTTTELANLLFTIIAAGNETTAGLITTGTYLLLSNPEQRVRLGERPELIENTIDEILRYESPLQNVFMRFALEDTEIDGEPIIQNEQVMGLIAAANRDPAVFPDPDRFDIERTNLNETLAFGHGIHFCIGRAIGRQTGVVTLGSLFRRFPDMRLAAEPTWRKTLPSRRLDRLDVLL